MFIIVLVKTAHLQTALSKMPSQNVKELFFSSVKLIVIKGIAKITEFNNAANTGKLSIT